ncbi:hypothetical protein ABEB36_000804 [Hypothenemus hampei]|uniref:Lipase domain-containing protein n=1 Tax=Hypothenemus hampei TaxID=57062 RepID=A0ABD1FCG6_HYPHA
MKFQVSLILTPLLLLLCFTERCQNFLYPLIDPGKLYNYVPPESQVSFYLYNYENLSDPNLLLVNDPKSIALSRYDRNLKTKFLIHGWSHHKDVPWLTEMREAMANTKQWNIIVVDWAPLSHVVYIEARVHTPVVAKQLAQMVFTLKLFAGLNASAVHLIGHSMGAHIAGYAGLKIQQMSKEKIERITGLDPAGPLFEWPHMEYLDEVLDPSDADFVDVIHTNGGRIAMITPAGHLDYYPNGGEKQPGCSLWICSHMRAVEYWTASIRNPMLFQSYFYKDYKRSSNVEELETYPMGILANKHFPHGTYYIETNEEYKDYIRTVTTIKDSYT